MIPAPAAAQSHEANQTLTVVLVNPSPDPVVATIPRPALPPLLTSFGVRVSSNGAYWQAAPRALLTAAQPAVVTVPGYGVATLTGTGLNADVSSAVGSPAVSLDAAGRLQIVSSRDAERAELGYAVEAAPALAGAGATWTTLATSTGGASFVALGNSTAAETGDGTFKTVTVQDVPTAGAPRTLLPRARDRAVS